MEKDLHEVAGLIRAGSSQDGEQEWLGTDKEWQNYEELLRSQENGDEINGKVDNNGYPIQ